MASTREEIEMFRIATIVKAAINNASGSGKAQVTIKFGKELSWRENSVV